MQPQAELVAAGWACDGCLKVRLRGDDEVRARRPTLDRRVSPSHATAMEHSDTLARLEATIGQRLQGDPTASYVAKLNAKGVGKIAQKVGEEATETVIAALSGDHDELVGEAADLIFHLMVLLGAKGVPLAQVLAELQRREGTSGIVEKAGRSN